MIQLGLIEYLNALPLTMLFDQNTKDVKLTYGVPSALNSLLRRGHLDCSLISAAEYIDGEHNLAAPLGIYARGKIRSVNLYIRGSIHSLEGAPVGVTEQSASSVSLLKVLCRLHWKVNPHYVALNRAQTADLAGFLLIGDEALEKESIPGFVTIDLATSWHEMTGLPFVFGVFATKTKSPDLSPISRLMQQSLALCKSDPAKLLQQAQKKTKLAPQTLVDYFKLCHHELDDAALAGLELFKRLRKDVYSKAAPVDSITIWEHC